VVALNKGRSKRRVTVVGTASDGTEITKRKPTRRQLREMESCIRQPTPYHYHVIRYNDALLIMISV
jgi:hypothetical protein